MTGLHRDRQLLPYEVAILVVDDDTLMRTFIGRTLKAEGYKVSAASGSVDALHALTEMNRLDVVLTDVALARRTGPDLAAEIRQSHPRVSVLYMSSSGREDLRAHGIHLNDETLLTKPFTPAELLARVRDILAQRTMGLSRSS